VKKLIRYLAIATVMAFCVRLVLFETTRVSSNSMFPNIWMGDWVMVTKFDYNIRIPFSAFEIVKFARPKRGEIASFCLPDHGIESFIKRVVAVAGDKMSLDKGLLSINGSVARYVQSENVSEAQLLTEEIPGSPPYRIQPAKAGAKDDYGPVDVPEGHFFVLNDNRNDLNDSRTWGPVPNSCLSGRPKLVLLSVSTNGDFRSERVGAVLH
jgi:signal peptidase I